MRIGLISDIHGNRVAQPGKRGFVVPRVVAAADPNRIVGGVRGPDVGGPKLSIDLRRTAFDVASFLELSRESGMPHAEWWISCWVRD